MWLEAGLHAVILETSFLIPMCDKGFTELLVASACFECLRCVAFWAGFTEKANDL